MPESSTESPTRLVADSNNNSKVSIPETCTLPTYTVTIKKAQSEVHVQRRFCGLASVTKFATKVMRSKCKLPNATSDSTMAPVATMTTSTRHITWFSSANNLLTVCASHAPIANVDDDDHGLSAVSLVLKHSQDSASQQSSTE